MAVGGLHRKDSEHGRLTTAMGIEMIAQAKNVLTPEGESIQVSFISKSCRSKIQVKIFLLTFLYFQGKKIGRKNYKKKICRIGGICSTDNKNK